jgi:bifunctional DNA-binding transcriptional regulator/antitoxin component of YhaV-PrlF toxin-antitoxin module
MGNQEIILKFQKHVDSNNRIVIPDAVVKALGNDFYLEYYKDKVILIPIKKEN